MPFVSIRLYLLTSGYSWQMANVIFWQQAKCTVAMADRNAVKCLDTVWILTSFLLFVKHTSKLYFLNLISTEDSGLKYQLAIHHSPQCHISQGFLASSTPLW